jgi:hypothetical protein
MTIEIKNIDETLLKSIVLQIISERKDLFKDILREVLSENKQMLKQEATSNDSLFSPNEAALLDEIFDENQKVLQMLAK